MPSASRLRRLDTIVGPFADLLLTADLPDLPAERRAEVVEFVQRRANGVPSFTRFGLTVIAVLFRGVLAVPGEPVWCRGQTMTCRVPASAEYDTLPTGRAS